MMIVVAMIASVRRTHGFKPSRILSLGSKPVSSLRLRSTLIISLPTWSPGERWRLTPLDSLGVSSFGCLVAQVPSNAISMRYFWNVGLKTSIAFVIVFRIFWIAASTLDNPLLANGPTRWTISLHAAFGSVTNERSGVPQCSWSSVA
jgi:hypothetical protein